MSYGLKSIRQIQPERSFEESVQFNETSHWKLHSFLLYVVLRRVNESSKSSEQNQNKRKKNTRQIKTRIELF